MALITGFPFLSIVSWNFQNLFSQSIMCCYNPILYRGKLTWPKFHRVNYLWQPIQQVSELGFEPWSLDWRPNAFNQTNIQHVPSVLSEHMYNFNIVVIILYSTFYMYYFILWYAMLCAIITFWKYTY